MEVLTRTRKWTFYKGVSPWILSKNRTFSYRRFSQKSYQKRSFLILWKEKKDFKRKKLKFSKGPKNGHFPKGLVYGFCRKIEISLMAVFYRHYVRKNRCSIFMKEDNHFETKKLKFLKGPKNGHFSKGLVHGFCPKSNFLLSLFFTEIMSDKIIIRYL